MGWKENKARYNEEYRKKNVKQVNLRINKNTAPDVIEWLDTRINITSYIIDLIREDMERKGFYKKWRRGKK